MTTLIICIVLSAASTLILLAPIMHSRPKTCYALIFLIPSISLATHLFINATAPYALIDLEKREIKNEANEEETLRQNLEKDPNDHSALTQLGGLLTKQERYDEAIAILTEGWRKNDHKDIKLQLAAAYFAKGLLFAEKEDYSTALYLLRVAKTKAPTDAPFYDDIQIFIDEVIEKRADAEKNKK